MSSYRPRLDRFASSPRNNSIRSAAIRQKSPKSVLSSFFFLWSPRLFPPPYISRFIIETTERLVAARCFSLPSPSPFVFFPDTVYPSTLGKLFKLFIGSTEARKLRTFTRARNVIRAVTGKVRIFQQIADSLDTSARVAHCETRPIRLLLRIKIMLR